MGFGGFSKYKICICNQNGVVLAYCRLNDVILAYCRLNDVVLIQAESKFLSSDNQNDVVLISAWSKRRRFDPGGKKKNKTPSFSSQPGRNGVVLGLLQNIKIQIIQYWADLKLLFLEDFFFSQNNGGEEEEENLLLFGSSRFRYLR